ncbi:proton-conducting transporter transmembrane domain-containing protein [Blastococcus sp. PRF04-17]|uniref:proton-conducting transporter transmembrane domain-containing protein n=1 Tax=Blastococcus sp. PRF04-17 TaxID=2933797 RepID=UPI0021125A4C|nr:proton-conducting transporter membrane subunit [Blastococcus sp. PRF04-17]
MLLVGVAWLTALGAGGTFESGGTAAVAALAASQPLVMQVVFLLLVGGFAVKAAVFPLHGWLPRAMVAPAPVSALLHAVAVVKAGAFGIVRVVHDVYGRPWPTAWACCCHWRCWRGSRSSTGRSGP